MKAYCITCKQIPWRREAAVEQFRAAGVDVEFFEGVHGPTLGLVPRLPAFDNRDFWISSAKAGMQLSFLLLLTVCRERPDEAVLVFEDDVQLVPRFRQELAESLAALPDDWDVCHVGHCCTEDKPTLRINDRVSEIRYPLCCHAVAYRRRAMPLLIDVLRSSCHSNHDILLAQMAYPRLRCYSLTPPLAWQDSCTTLSEAHGEVTWATIPGRFAFARLYDEALDRVGAPARFVEIGSGLGRSTAYMAEEIKRRYKPVEFWAVDTWQSKNQLADVGRRAGDIFPLWRRNMSRAGVLDYVKPLQMPSVEAAIGFADGSLDFVFVNGDHVYANVLADLQAWTPKLRPGGVMAGDDYGVADVDQAVREYYGSDFRTWEHHWIVDR